MKIFDSHKKNNWNSFGIEFLKKNIIMSSKSSMSAELPDFDFVKIKVIGKKISGNGFLKLSFKDKDGKILFSQDIKFTKSSWSEYSLECNTGLRAGSFEIVRPNNSYGRIEIGRITLDDGLSKDIVKKERANKDIDFSDFHSGLLREAMFKRKVAVIIPYGIYGGGEVYIKNIFSDTKDLFNVDFLYLSKNNLEIEISNLNIKHKYIGNLNRMGATLINNRYDTVIFYNSKKVYDVISGLKREKKISSKIVEIYHSNFLWGDAVARTRTRSNVDFIFKVSANLANDISGIKDDRKILMPVGIDTNLFVRNDNTSLRRELGVDGRKTIIGMVARLSPEKNIEYALSLVKGLDGIQLIIIGSGPEESRLKEFAKINNIKNVLFLGYKKNIQDFYNIFDAFLLTSKIEGTPISILEAMSHCLPIYSTAAGEIASDFGHLDNFNILSGSLDADRVLVQGQINMPNYFQNLREYIIENHDIKIISNKFFMTILNNFLSFKNVDDSSRLISGEYI